MAKRSTENAEAYQLYLRGRHHWSKRTPGHLKKGIEYFQQAIEKDPTYALAYSGLADCQSILALFSAIPPKSGLAKAKAAAASAVALDPDLAEGYTSLAFIEAYFDCDWPAADKGFQRALEIDPKYWVTPYWHAFVLMSRGLLLEAEQRLLYARGLEPLSPVVLHAAALAAVLAGRYDEAEERCLTGLEYDPSYFLLMLWLGLALQCKGKYGEAILAFEKSRDSSSGAALSIGALGNCHAVAGNRDAASTILTELVEKCQREHVGYYQIALIYAGLGDYPQALLWLENACAARDAFLPLLVKVDPRLRALHGESRFQDLLLRIKLS